MSFTLERGCSDVIVTAFENIARLIMWATSNEIDGTIEDYGIAIGDNGLIQISRGRDTINFQPVNSGTTQDLKGADIRSGGFSAFAVGNNGTIVRSTNRGVNWSVIPTGSTANLNAVRFGFGGNHFAVGDNGTILKSSNLGQNWSAISSTTTRNLNAVSSHANSIEFVVAAGDKGTILRSTNFGLNWINVSLTDTSVNIYSINPASVGISQITSFYICGSQGRIYKSTNFGSTWILKNSGTTNTLRSIYFSSEDSGAVTGDNGTVRMTTNGGETWFADPYFNNVPGNITSISQMPRSTKTFTALSNNNTLLVASEDSVTVIIGIQTISTEIPKTFSLSQNYPNPFNPNTSFDLQLSKSGFVKLEIFDITGKAVETLISQELKAGTYRIDWNGSKYSSGVYFYKVITNEIVETKKMVLVK